MGVGRGRTSGRRIDTRVTCGSSIGSPEEAASDLGSSAPVTNASGPASATPSPAESTKRGSARPRSRVTSASSSPQMSLPLISGQEDSPAKTSPSPGPVLASAVSGRSSSFDSLSSPQFYVRDGSSWRTSQDSFQFAGDGISASSLDGWMTSGTWAHGACSTRGGSESPNDAVACSLSAILETERIPQRYFLSPKAAVGILRRAERRGKTLPDHLAVALRALAARASTSTTEPSS